MASRTLWCEHAILPGGVTAAGVVVEVDEGRITSVASDVRLSPPGAEVRRGVTVPGFANAHSHAFHRALRGRTHAGEGTFWTWREQMYAVAGRLSPSSYERLARAVYGEMALAGITCVGEFHYLHHDAGGAPFPEANAMGLALIDAAAATGIRMTLLDTCYLRAGIGASAPALDATQQRFSDGSAEAWAARASRLAEGPMVRIGAAIHSVRAVDPPAVEVVRQWAAARSAPLHAHVSEQPAENEACLAEHGVTPTVLLERHGALGPRFTAVHATHLTAADVAAYGASGSTCCFCPTTERDLADGIGPSAELRRAGVPISLGSDSHAVIDLLEEARGVELDERLSSLRRGSHPAAALLEMATANGHRCLGWPDGGAIGVGALADLVTVSLDGVRMAGAPRRDLVAALVFAAGAPDVTDVIVAGEDVVCDARHVRIDVAAELGRSIDELWEEVERG